MGSYFPEQAAVYEKAVRLRDARQDGFTYTWLGRLKEITKYCKGGAGSMPFFMMLCEWREAWTQICR